MSHKVCCALHNLIRFVYHRVAQTLFLLSAFPFQETECSPPFPLTLSGHAPIHQYRRIHLLSFIYPRSRCIVATCYIFFVRGCVSSKLYVCTTCSIPYEPFTQIPPGQGQSQKTSIGKFAPVPAKKQGINMIYIKKSSNKFNMIMSYSVVQINYVCKYPLDTLLAWTCLFRVVN